MVKVDLSGAETFYDNVGPDFAAAASAHRTLVDKSGAGANFTGWSELPHVIKSGELKKILNTAQKIRSRSKYLIVIGIGGSSLGARAAIELLKPYPSDDETHIIFAGNGFSPDSINQIIRHIGENDFDVNVISKSGTTLEPSLSFKIFRSILKDRYGNSAKKHIFATTDSEKGTLKSLADSEGWESFVVPDDVGGRYSVLSSVGLLPMAVAGIDVKKIINVAIDEFSTLLELRSPDNPAWQYAASRQHLYGRGKNVEVLASFEPSFHYMSLWWQQLYGESEGKNGIGIFPSYVEYTSDLYSMGQYIQDGPRNLQETVVKFENNRSDFQIPFEMGDPDLLNYLAGKDIGEINTTAASAIKTSHIAGGVPNTEILVPEINEEGFSSLVCFFELSCAISAYMSGVNPFDQPGIEAYKKNMYRMLGKPNLNI